ncbi:phage portal protein [Sporanaerobacter acetigenes]|uniref:phage portal protein n=1 Tax=Sporanaerobacter acetigenes TaxID=165813 RepID=UPI00104331D0|nr:phage portal protein [Sporanaerobacter acetigenes]
MGATLNETLNKRSKPIHLDSEPTPELISQLIQHHQRNNLERYQMLQDYYEGYNIIINRTKKDSSKPNNRLVSGYPSYIVDLMQGYFIGKPVTYTSSDKDLIEEIQDVFNYNDEQDENSELAKMCGIKGKAYEIVYIDEDSKIRFNEIDADYIIMVYDTKINPEPNFAIRYYYGASADSLTSGKGTLNVTVYTKDRIYYYVQGDGGLVLLDEEEHYFQEVPVIEFLNNDEGMGDFERVISLIDAYDKTQSDTANDFEEFTDAFLYLVNLNGTEDEDIEKLKEDKVLLLDEEGQAGWLIKDINDSAIENYKKRLNDDIHKFAKIPDITDEKFMGNTSGESMKYKLLALDQVIAAKQRKFKRALQKRLELICSYLQWKTGQEYDYRDIDINFIVNRPVNEKEMVEMAIQMLGITSLSTALAKVPGVDDVEMELAKIEEEKGTYREDIDLDEIGDEDDETR